MAGVVSPIPGSIETCRGVACGNLVTVGRDAVPAGRVTWNRRSRGFYCPACAERAGVKVR